MAEILRIVPQEAPQKPGFCMTQTAEDIIDRLAICKETPDWGTIVGEPGVGKTEAARHFVQGHAHAWLVTISPGCKEVVPCLQKIASVVGAPVSNTGALALREAIERTIGNRYGAPMIETDERGALLIFDEAQHLTDGALEEVRAIYDAVKVGVVLMGNRGLVDRWATMPGAKRNAWAQLTSRVGQALDIPAVAAEDIEAICRHYGIAGKPPRKLLHLRAQGKGGLRTVTKLLTKAALLAGDGQRIELRHIEEAERLSGAQREVAL